MFFTSQKQHFGVIRTGKIYSGVCRWHQCDNVLSFVLRRILCTLKKPALSVYHTCTSTTHYPQSSSKYSNNSVENASVSSLLYVVSAVGSGSLPLPHPNDTARGHCYSFYSTHKVRDTAVLNLYQVPCRKRAFLLTYVSCCTATRYVRRYFCTSSGEFMWPARHFVYERRPHSNTDVL